MPQRSAAFRVQSSVGAGFHCLPLWDRGDALDRGSCHGLRLVGRVMGVLGGCGQSRREGGVGWLQSLSSGGYRGGVWQSVSDSGWPS